MSYKVDFHTHSMASPDGALSADQYRRLLEYRRLDAMAVTDHNTTDFARQLHAELGDRIIVGEEITTAEGEIIGLYLTTTIPPFLSAADTVRAIHSQGGLVYIPHPFETVRKGLTHATMRALARHIDIIETRNSRAVFQNRGKAADIWAATHHIPAAASSDAHGMSSGIGRTYTLLAEMPTRDNLLRQLENAYLRVSFPGVRGMMYPKLNRLRKWKWHA